MKSSDAKQKRFLLRAGKNIKKEFKFIAREKRKCKHLYHDWRDDEYNCLHNKFIWARTYESNPSFATPNTAEVYYNRQTKTYYFAFDSEFYPEVHMLQVALDAFVKEFPAQEEYKLDGKSIEDMVNFGMQASTLEGLVAQAKFLLTAIKNYGI